MCPCARRRSTSSGVKPRPSSSTRSVAERKSRVSRTSTDLARACVLAQSGDAVATELLKSLAERTAIGGPALRMICREFQFNLMLNIIFETLEGKPLAGGNVAFRATARL